MWPDGAGPLPKTLVDFWRLVWQEKPPTIVMVTNLKEGTKIKCQQYWPESGTKDFGPFQITMSDEQTLADYTTRTLVVQVRPLSLPPSLPLYLCVSLSLSLAQGRFGASIESDSVPLHCLA